MAPKPLAPKALLDYLEKCYPDRCPSPDMTDREVWMMAGAAQVIRKLKSDINEASQQ